MFVYLSTSRVIYGPRPESACLRTRQFMAVAHIFAAKNILVCTRQNFIKLFYIHRERSEQNRHIMKIVDICKCLIVYNLESGVLKGLNHQN